MENHLFLCEVYSLLPFELCQPHLQPFLTLCLYPFSEKKCSFSLQAISNFSMGQPKFAFVAFLYACPISQSPLRGTTLLGCLRHFSFRCWCCWFACSGPSRTASGVPHFLLCSLGPTYSLLIWLYWLWEGMGRWELRYLCVWFFLFPLERWYERGGWEGREL